MKSVESNSEDRLVKFVWFQWLVDVQHAQVVLDDFEVFLRHRQVSDVIHNGT